MSEITFGETSGGAAMVQGSYVSADASESTVSSVRVSRASQAGDRRRMPSPSIGHGRAQDVRVGHALA